VNYPSIVGIRDGEITGTFMLHDPAFADLDEFAVGREVKIRNDRPMVFPLRWFYRLRERFLSKPYPTIVVWSGRIGSIRWEQEAENQWAMTGQIERIDT
jgi:hypothetical protein